MNRAEASKAALPGDVLRACTATNFVFSGVAALLGAAAPVRTIVLYGADGQKWSQVNRLLPRNCCFG